MLICDLLLNSFAPHLLLLHCSFIFFFKKWLGPLGTFYSSLIIYSFLISLLCSQLYNIFLTGYYFYIDFGRWFFCLNLIDVTLTFCVDSLSLVCAILVLFLTMLALYFGVEYMYREVFINRLLYLLNLFATSVILLFFCYDFFLILIAWESIGLFSFLLVNFYTTRIYTLKAAFKTFVFSRISDMFMFLAFILTLLIFNSTDLSLMFAQIPFFTFYYLNLSFGSLHVLTTIAWMLALSGVIKAAQFFFHVWLPDAMEAPTPASALIHSSTLVIAGIFLIIRFSILFEFTLLVNSFLLLLGALTLSFAAITAIFQTDIKKLVAYSTISQIGYLVCGCGFCCYEEVLLYLIIHALNKAFLFILVGYTVHFFSGNTDMRQMGGASVFSLDICIFMFTVGFNLAGLPYSAGFFAKEFLLFQLLRNELLTFFVRGCWLVSFFFTPIYMFLILFNAFFNFKKGDIKVYLIPQTSFVSLRLWTNNTWYFQWTAITARSTTLLLFFFWFFFLFIGEFLLLMLFNLITLTDTINSSFFFIIKAHTQFFIFLISDFTSQLILYLILFFAINAVSYLLLLKKYYTINIFTSLYLYELISILLGLLMFII